MHSAIFTTVALSHSNLEPRSFLRVFPFPPGPAFSVTLPQGTFDPNPMWVASRGGGTGARGFWHLNCPYQDGYSRIHNGCHLMDYYHVHWEIWDSKQQGAPWTKGVAGLDLSKEGRTFFFFGDRRHPPHPHLPNIVC